MEFFDHKYKLMQHDTVLYQNDAVTKIEQHPTTES